MLELRRAGMMFVAIACMGMASAEYVAEYKVVTAHENKDVRLYTVTDNGNTWKFDRVFKTKTADGGQTPISVATDGVYIYIGDKKAPNNGDSSWVHKYRMDGTYAGVFLDLSNTCRLDSIAIDPQREWLYVAAAFGDDNGKKNRIYRYRLSDPSDGGAYITTGLNTPREIMFGPDGLLYVSSRYQNVQVYDVSGATPGFLRTYAAPASNGGVAVDERYVHIPSGASVRRYDLTNSTTAVDISVGDLNNAFCSFNLAGTAYIGSYVNGKVIRCLEDGTYTTVATLENSLCGLCCVPMPVAHYRFDEPANATIYTNCMGATTYPIRPYGDLRSGSTGVDGGGLWFSETAFSRGFIKNSIGIIDQSATNDFSICFWGGLRTSSYTGERIFLANNYSQPERCAFAVNLGGNTGKLTFFHPAGSATHLVSTSRVDDAHWHHIGVVRRGGRTEMWIDGRLENSQADEGKMTQTGDWTLGSLNGALNRLRDGVMDELRFYRCALSPEDILGIYARTVPANLTLPTDGPADPPPPDHAAATELGAIVRYQNVLANPLGVQTLAIAPDGTYWAACGAGVSGGYEDSPTTIHKSTDRGATWQCVGTNTTVAQASIVVNGGKLWLVGTRNTWDASVNARFASSSDGVTWATYDTTTGINGARGRVVPYGDTCWVGTAIPGVLNFSLADGSPAQTKHVNILNVINDNQNSRRRWVFSGGYLEPTLLAIDGSLKAMVPSVMKEGSAYTAGPGYVLPFNVTANNATLESTFTMPGGSKAFDVVFDETTARYWAVTAPERRVASSALPQAVNHVLALYSSVDGQTWNHHVDFATTTFGEKGFIAPSIAIDGDDLAVLFAASVPDASVTPPSTMDANYVLFRKVANFRDLPAQKIDRSRFLLVADTWANGVSRYHPTEAGDWVFGGYVVTRGTYGGLALDQPHGLAWGPDSLYVNNMDGTNVFEFAHDGTFKRMVADFWTPDNSQAIDNIALSCDHRYLYCSDMIKRHCIWRIDLATLEKTEWVAAASGIVSGVRGLVPMRDGSLVVADRVLNRVIRINADGSLREVLVPSNTANFHKPQAICYDAKHDLFYVDANDDNCTYSFPNRANAPLTKVAPYHSFSLTMLGGKVYNSIWEDGAVMETVPELLTTTDGKRAKNAIIATGVNCAKILGVEFASATVILVR